MNLRPVDVLLLGYTLVTTVLAVSRLGDRPGTAWLLVSNGLLVLLVLALATSPRLRGSLLREVYPMLLLLGLYGALDVLNGAGTIATHDGLVMAWEDAIFGSQVSREWWRNSASPFWSTVLHASYLSYYLIVPLPVVLFARRGYRLDLRQAVLAIMLGFVVCYLCFLFLPVAGPYYVFHRPSGEFLDNWAATAVYCILEGGSSYGAAFPSSHVAATVAAAGAAWLSDRRIGALLIPPTALLTMGVVYTQMHYAVDAVAGVLVGLAAILLSAALTKRPAGKDPDGPKY